MRTRVVMGLVLGLLMRDEAGAQDGQSIHVNAFDLPQYSAYLRAETRVGLERQAELWNSARKVCDPFNKTTGEEIRACEAKMYPPIMAEARKVYDVRIAAQITGGVYTDVVTPAEGVSQKHAQRVLINVHGGGFMTGARFGGQLEAMPVAAIGKYKVITVDYRMAPEHHFPAASLDVAAVYRELLKEYDAASIGLYGCSAGGWIVGQTIAWMQRHALPRPGAVAILCSAPMRPEGDSTVIVAALQGRKPSAMSFDDGYFKGVRPTDPLAFPGDFEEVLARFPPALLMTSMRDYSLSPMVQMHARLVRLGVPTELHVFEGLGHGDFVYKLHIPETREAALALSAFFDTHLRAVESAAAPNRAKR